jgi:hypothetical protein
MCVGVVWCWHSLLTSQHPPNHFFDTSSSLPITIEEVLRQKWTERERERAQRRKREIKQQKRKQEEHRRSKKRRRKRKN